MISKGSQSKTANVLRQLLHNFKIKVNKASVYNCLSDHPNSKSLFAISDCLNGWKVNNNAVRFNKSTYNSKTLDFPFIAHFGDDGGQFVLIQNIKDGFVKYYDGIHVNATMSEEEFLRIWSGVVLYVKPNLSSGETDYRKIWFQQIVDKTKLPVFTFLLFICCFLVLYQQKANWLFFFLIGIKMIGLLSSILLIVQRIDSDNSFLLNLCSFHGRNDCNKILDSNASKLNEWLSWSDVGFLYFSSTVLLLLVEPLSINFLVIISILTLPYTFYSIIYQFRNNNWCILCCTIQVILWIEFGICFQLFNLNKMAYSILPSLYMLSLCFLLPTFLWIICKPFLKDSVLIKSYHEQLIVFKYDIEIFRQILKKQKKYIIQEDVVPLTFEQNNSSIEIVIISNPICLPCAIAHEKITNLIAKGRSFKLSIIFMVPEQTNDIRYKVACHLLALMLNGDQQNTYAALSDWYIMKFKSYEEWASKYPVSIEENSQVLLKKHQKWCQESEINASPTILINGFKLPDMYSLEDLQWLID